jgi:O-methyltransferase involved in polyketide biosynthesis
VDEFFASRTALATSLMRALHTRLDPDPFIDDPWGDRLVPESAREAIRQSALAKMDPVARAKALASLDSIVDASLRASATCGAPGGELVFTYLDESVFNSASESFRELRNTVASMGEPFQSEFNPEKVSDDLRRTGLTLVGDLDGEQIAERYGRTGSNSLRASATSHIDRARVAG